MRRQELHPRTAAINKTQKNQSKMARNHATAWLAATFPKAFDTTTHIRPLKIGIIQDIFAYLNDHPEIQISSSKIREALVVFTRQLEYLACLKARETRVDLNGNSISPVTAEEAEKAAQKIKKRIEKNTKNSNKNHSIEKPNLNINKPSYNQVDPHYFERTPISMNTGSSLEKVTTIIRHKASRQFDPSAVNRLKEKLGLSRKTTEESLIDES